MNILIIGPAHPLRGGIANFTERLARAFEQEGDHVEVLSFSLQYPSFLFPGKTQYTTKPAPSLKIRTRLSSVNPFTWLREGMRIRRKRYDRIIVMYWLPFMAPCLGTVLRVAGKRARRIAQLHNIIPHEPKPMDRWFSKYFTGAVDGFLALSQSVLDDLHSFDKKKPTALNPHPIYDNFGEIIPKEKARKALGLDTQRPVILFFGFVRKYKGLDLLLEAMADKGLKEKNVLLVVAGEFYESTDEYMQIIQNNQLENVILHNKFIDDKEVALYFSACDMVVQPYRSATQSGVTQIGYHFEKPMLVTDVGGLSEIIPHGKAGYVVEPDPVNIAEAINHFYDQNREEFMVQNVIGEKSRYAWDKLVIKLKKL